MYAYIYLYLYILFMCAYGGIFSFMIASSFVITGGLKMGDKV